MVLAAAWVAIATKAHAHILPPNLARQVGHNAEGLVLVLLIGPWLALIADRRRPSWAVTWGLSGVMLVVGLVLSFGVDVKTLATVDESCFGAAVLIPYIRLARPLPRLAWSVPALAFAIPALFSSTSIGELLAEVYGFCLLIPLYLDLVDRHVLEPDQPRRPVRLLVWVAALVVVPVVVSAARVEDPSGFVQSVVRYLSRPTEAMVASLLLTAWFSWGREALRR